MMEDPEAEVHYEYAEVWATSAAEAASKCATIAENRTREGGSLVSVEGSPTQVTQRPTKEGKYFYRCRLRAEQ